MGALHDEIVLELRDRSEHVEEQTATRSGGVDALRQGLQPDPTLLKLVRDLLEVPYRPAEAVKLRHHERVTLSQIPKGFRQRRPFRKGPGRVFDEVLVAACSFECIGLAVRILVPGRDAGVTDRGHASAYRERRLL